MAKQEKVEKVAALTERIQGADALLLTDYRGLTVGDAKELRRELADADASFAVVKNTLFKRAADGAGLGVLAGFLNGPTAAIFVRGDAVTAAKRLADAAAKFDALEIKGGYMDGKMLSAEEASALSKLKTRDEMLAQLAGMMKADLSRAASLFTNLQGRFLGLLEAYKEKLPPAEAPAAAETSETPEASEAQGTPEAVASAAPEPEAPDIGGSDASESTPTDEKSEKSENEANEEE